MQIIQGKQVKAQKIILYGPEGIGKSTFLSRFPNVMFIDTEDSTINLDVARFPKPSSWTMLLEQVDYVLRNPDICQTLAVDTMDWAERLCIEHIIAKGKVDGIEGFGYGKGYVYLEEEFGRYLNKLQDVIEAGINVASAAHAEIKKIEQPEEIGGYDHWQMKLEKKTMQLLREWADILLFVNYKVHVINVDNQGAQKGKNKAQGGKRVMYTTHSPWWDAKNRHDLLEELPFDYDEIKHCIITRDTKAATPPPPAPPQEPQTPQQISKQEVDEFEQMIANVKSGASKPQADWKDISIPTNIPRPLYDLMKEHSVTEQEIQRAVASRGYYPADTPIDKYDPNFVSGVLVGAWPQVLGMIKELETIPY